MQQLSLALFTGFLASCSSGGQAPVPVPCRAVATSAITGGKTSIQGITTDTSNAVVALELATGETVCSGMLVSERWVLTARHCVEDNQANGLVVRVQTALGDTRSIASAYEVAHDWDVALVEFPPSESVSSLGLRPLQLATTLGASLLGQSVVLAGYGQSDDGQRGILRFARETVTDLDSDHITVDGQGVSGACSGDSGGPLFDTSAAEGSLVVGVLSNGSSDCHGKDRFVRTDVLGAWLAEVFERYRRDPCVGYTWEGTCHGGAVTYCSGNALVTELCTDHRVCGWDSLARGYRCVRLEDDPCEGATADGDCRDNVLRVCREGILQLTDCSQCGQRCDWQGNGGASCR